MPFISLFGITSVVFPDPKIFYVFPHLLLMLLQLILKEVKKLLANGLITLFINGNPVFNNGRSNLLRNPPDCIIFDNWVFVNLISSDKLFAKDLQRFKTSLSVNDNLWGKLVSLSPIMFDDNLSTTFDSFFIADFNLLSC